MEFMVPGLNGTTLKGVLLLDTQKVDKKKKGKKQKKQNHFKEKDCKVNPNCLENNNKTRKGRLQFFSCHLAEENGYVFTGI